MFKPVGVCLPQQVRPGLPSHLLQHCRTFSESKPLIQELVRRRDLVFYNASETQLLGDSVNTAASFNCAMQRAAPIGGKWSPKHHSYQWLKTVAALEIAGLPAKGAFSEQFRMPKRVCLCGFGSKSETAKFVVTIIPNSWLAFSNYHASLNMRRAQALLLCMFVVRQKDRK